MNTTFRYLAAIVLISALAACAAPPTRYYGPPPADPLPTQAQAQVYAYPTRGQSDALARRDRYECHNQSVSQSGYDPNQAPVTSTRTYTPQARMTYENTAFMAFTGALMGASVSSPRNSGTGAAIGALLGALTGAVSDSAQAQRTQSVVEAREASVQQTSDRYAEKMANYRQTLASCLSKRGYTVR